MRRVCIIALLGLLPTFAAAEVEPTSPQAYAWQWPLTLSVDAPLARIELPTEVYAQLHRNDLRDLAAFNANAEAMPLAPIEQWWSDRLEQRERVALPMFATPRAASSHGESLDLRVERDANGRLRQLQARIDGGVEAVAQDWLLDLSDQRANLHRLQFDLQDSAKGSLNARIEVAGSDDLNQWRVLVPSAALLSLQQDGLQLERLAVAINGPRHAYLRLRRVDAELPLPIKAVTAELVSGQYAPPVPRELRVVARAVADMPGSFEVTLDGPYPMHALEVVPTSRNALASMRVESRADAGAPWRERAQGTLFRIDASDGELSAAPISLDGRRDRQWRVHTTPALAQPPTLVFSWRADTFVVLAQGDPPYRLVAGSARATRPDYPFAPIISELQLRHGPNWRPPLASLAAGGPAGGADALQSPPEPLPLRRYALMTTLAIAALLVIGMVLRLLRQPPT